MSKQDIINYLIKTPENTNPNVVRDMLSNIVPSGESLIEIVTGSRNETSALINPIPVSSLNNKILVFEAYIEEFSDTLKFINPYSSNAIGFFSTAIDEDGLNAQIDNPNAQAIICQFGFNEEISGNFYTDVHISYPIYFNGTEHGIHLTFGDWTLYIISLS